MKTLFTSLAIFLLAATVIYLSLFIYSFFRIITYNDISLEPVYNKPHGINHPPVYLISYADGPEVFYKNQHALVVSALNKGIDFIFNYRRVHLDASFVEKNADILSKSKGSGFWLWKPYVVLKTLHSVPENSIVVYADTGFVFRRPFDEYFDQLQTHDMLLLHSDEPSMGKAINKSKRETWIRLDIDDAQHLAGPYIMGGFMILRNTSATRVFIQKWLDLCQDPSLLLEGPSSQPEYPEFQNHTHDQAILTALYNKYPEGKALISYSQQGFLVWHHRHPPTQNLTLLPEMGKKITGFGRWLLTYPWIVKLRTKMLETK